MRDAARRRHLSVSVPHPLRPTGLGNLRCEMKWDLFVPDNPTALWTMLLTVATVGFSVIAWKGLKSFKLAKADYLTRNLREARGCAIARCEEFAAKIIHDNAELHAAFGLSGIAPFHKPNEAVDFDASIPAVVQGARDWIQQIPAEVRYRPQTILNYLEAWAMYFTHDLADESVAFAPCAAVFCSMIVRYRPYIIDIRAKETSGKYPNVVALFQRWTERMDAQANGDVENALWQQIAEVQARSAPKPFIKPIGTQVDT